MIIQLTSVHPSTDTRIFVKQCRSLRAAGYDVTLIAPHERDEILDGIRIRAVPQTGHRVSRMTRTVWHVLLATIQEKAKIYHFHDPELIPVGLFLKILGRTVVYDVHEDVPRDVLSKHWIPRGLRWLVSGGLAVLEGSASRAFDGIVAATPAIAARFPRRKTLTVQNFVLPEELMRASSQPYAHRPLAAAYVGDITWVRGIKEMVEAIGLLPERLGAKLVLAGRFSPPKLEAEIQRLAGWKRVEFVGYQSRKQLGRLLARVRVGLAVFHPEPNHTSSQPNKLFEYMSAGIPVVASDFPLWRQIVKGANCGVLVDPLDPIDIARAIQWLLGHANEAEAMGKRGQEMVRKRYNWATEAQKLLRLYAELTK